MTDTTTTDDSQGQGSPETLEAAHSGTGLALSPDEKNPPQEDAHVDEQQSPNKEAAKYRRQLREAETERDALLETVTALRRAEVERIAGTTITRPEGLWAAGVDVNDLIDESGRIDEEKVRAATIEAADRLGLASRARNNVVPGAGRTPSVNQRNGWNDAFAPPRD